MHSFESNRHAPFGARDFKSNPFIFKNQQATALTNTCHIAQGRTCAVLDSTVESDWAEFGQEFWVCTLLVGPVPRLALVALDTALQDVRYICIADYGPW